MGWVTIDGTHINTNNIQSFYWNEHDDMLEIWWVGTSTKAVVPDPDRKHYTKLCEFVRVRPYNPSKEDSNGNI